MIDNLRCNGDNFPLGNTTAYKDANENCGKILMLKNLGPKFSPCKSPSKYVPNDPGLGGAQTLYNEEYKPNNYTAKDSPNKYNDFVKNQRKEEKGRNSNGKFVQDVISEAKDQYVPKQYTKGYKVKNMREESSNVKSGYGVYDTTYGEYFAPKDYVRFFWGEHLEC